MAGNGTGHRIFNHIGDLTMSKEEVYCNAREGQIFESREGTWIKPEQNVNYHLDGMLVNIFTGNLECFNKLTDLRPISFMEIMY
jgi:hypothetical protein